MLGATVCVRQCDGAAAALPASFCLPLRLVSKIRQAHLIHRLAARHE